MVTRIRNVPGLRRGVTVVRRLASSAAHNPPPNREACSRETLGTLQQLRSELQQERLGRQAIQELSASLLQQTSVGALANRLLEGLSGLVRADHGSVMLLDDGGAHLEIVAHIGLPREASRRVPVEDAVGGTILRSGEPALLLGSVHADRAAQREVQSALVLPIVCRGKALGVVNLNRRPDALSFSSADLELTATVVATFSAMFDAVRQLERNQVMMLSTIRALARAVEAKDPYTRGHCERVAQYCRGVGEDLGLEPVFIDQLEIGATLHDVGKIGVPEEVLLKPGPLNDSEREAICRHPSIGADIVRPVGLPMATLQAVLYHHERLDGGGYPHGLVGDDIPLAARILAVVDAFDAMTMARPYRGARSFAEAYRELRRCSGTQFDVDVVETFLAFCEREQLHERLASLRVLRDDAPALNCTKQSG